VTVKINPNYKATLVILNDVEAHELVQFNPEYADEEFFENFLEFEEAFTHSFVNVIKTLDSSEKDHDNMSVFAIYSELSYIISYLEVITKILKVVINPTMIKNGFNDFTTLEQMIKKIYNKMQYSEKLKNSIRGLFLVDFKNAIDNQYFLIHKNGNLVIYSKDEKMKKYLNIEDLYDYSLQVIAILNSMIDWSNGQETSVDEKTQGLDLVQDLINQVKLLDGKLNKLA
jgi:hypothetical protein